MHARLVTAGLVAKPAGGTAEPATATVATVSPAPAAPAPAVTPAPAAAAPVQVATAPANAPIDTKAAQALIDATFGLVRAQPDGSLVIAGSAKPGETVQVYADDKLLGETKTEDTGDWVLVPDKPIATGGVELTLGIAGSDKRAAQSFVVAIDPGKKAEPLVVASTPGQMSTVLQGLAQAKTAVASTDAAAAAPAAAAPDTKIGRASCRERVFKDV